MASAPVPVQARLGDDDPLPPEDRLDLAPSLGALYRSCSGWLARYFARHGGGSDVPDLVHDAFVRMAANGPAAAAAIEVPEAYLHRVATNLLRDRARAAARRAIEAHNQSPLAPAEDLDPHQVLEERERLARVEIVVARMSARRRRIFLLHRIHGLTYAQIAEEVGMSIKGVKKQMAKALSDLRRDAGPF